MPGMRGGLLSALGAPPAAPGGRAPPPNQTSPQPIDSPTSFKPYTEPNTHQHSYNLNQTPTQNPHKTNFCNSNAKTTNGEQTNFLTNNAQPLNDNQTNYSSTNAQPSLPGNTFLPRAAFQANEPYQPSSPQTVFQPTGLQIGLQPTNPQTCLQPTGPQTGFQPTSPETGSQPTSSQMEFQPTSFQTGFQRNIPQTVFEPSGPQLRFQSTSPQSVYTTLSPPTGSPLNNRTGIPAANGVDIHSVIAQYGGTFLDNSRACSPPRKFATFVHKPPRRKIFVGGAPPNIDEQTLYRIFSSFGEIEDVYIMKGGARSGQACAMIRYRTEQDALMAIKNSHGRIMLPRCHDPLVVRFANSPSTTHREKVDTINNCPSPFMDSVGQPGFHLHPDARYFANRNGSYQRSPLQDHGGAASYSYTDGYGSVPFMNVPDTPVRGTLAEGHGTLSSQTSISPGINNFNGVQPAPRVHAQTPLGSYRDLTRRSAGGTIGNLESRVAALVEPRRTKQGFGGVADVELKTANPWRTQVTPDGRLFYTNQNTGVSQWHTPI